MNREVKPEKPAEVRAMNAPSGIDLRPQPARAVQVSKRAGIALCCLAFGVLGLFAYGGYKRQLREQTAARSEAKQVAPATAAGTEILKEIQSADVSGGRPGAPKLEPPPDSTKSTKTNTPPTHPAHGPAVPSPVQPGASFQRAEPTPEEKRLVWAYQQEQAAMAAPTAINGGGSSVRGSSIDSPRKWVVLKESLERWQRENERVSAA